MLSTVELIVLSMLMILSEDVALVAAPTVFNAELCNSAFKINSTQWHM